jgi:5-methylthioadenosine/S-adenosylhomocysteine deaminase
MTETNDYILAPRWLVTVETPGVLTDHAVVVADGAIVAVLPSTAARAQYPDAPWQSLPQHALIPGLVNLHCHAAMTLLRGYGDDLPLMRWLIERIWPAEKKHASADFVRDGSLLAAAEMLSSGVTTVNDMYFFPEAAAEAFLQAGMRAALGIMVIDFPSAYAADADGYLQRGLATRDALKDEPLLSFMFAPHAPYTLSDATFGKIATLADQLGLAIHIHLHETADEIADSLKHHGVRPLERLARLGLLGPNFIGVHAVHLSESEIALLAQHGCHIAHCPTSNLKLAAGIAPVAALLQAGVNVGFGSDSAASNNRLDVFAEMRLAALLANGTSSNATALPAQRALYAATLGAARALNLDHLIGSIAAGKRADLVAVDLGDLNQQPVYDPVSHLVYVAGRDKVSYVWVDGVLKLDAGKLVGLDAADLGARAQYWHAKIARCI